MNANIIALIAAIFFAIGAVFFKLNTIKKGDEYIYQLGLFFSGSIILWLSTLYLIDTYAIDNYIVPSILIGISLLMSNLLFMRSLENLPVGIVSPIVNLNVVLIVLSSIYYYGEVVTNLELTGSFLILIGLLLFAKHVRKYDKQFRKFLFILMMVTLLFMTIRNGGLKYTFESGFSNVLILWYSHFIALILISLFVLLRKSTKSFSVSGEGETTTLFRGALGGIFSSIGLLLYGIALENGNASTILPIFCLYLVILLLVSRFFLGEKLTFLNYVTFSLVFLGTIIIIS